MTEFITNGPYPKWPKTLVLMRHGQSERNVMKDLAKANGQKPRWTDGVRDQDTPLTELGVMQALSAGVELRKSFPGGGIIFREGQTGFGLEDVHPKKIDIIYVSPYLRALQTAEQVIRGLGYAPEVVREERIREIEFGILDGLTPDGIQAKYPEEIARRAKEGKYFYRPPGGESRPDVNLRVHSFLGTLTRSARDKNILVVCHSVVVMCFRHLLERWGEEEYLQVDKEQDIKNASLTTYQCIDNKLLLIEFNRTTIYDHA